MDAIARTLLGSFRITHASFELATDDLDRRQLLHRARDGAGPSIFWQLGHVLCYRVIAINRLGVARENPYMTAFGETAASDGTDYPPLETLRAEWNALHDELERALDGVGDAEMLSKYRLADGRESSRTLLEALSFYAWHEAAHMGGLTGIRVELGVPSLAERTFGPPRKR
jgi:uncharacterized damage-inducible protein DinB